MKNSPALILASTSPRRMELLAQAKLAFETARPEADETPRKGEAPHHLVRRLARAKAESVAAARAGRAVVISADTIVVAPGGKAILNKPRDREEAIAMVTRLAGRTHTVLTGYCLLETGSSRGKGRRIERVVSTQVTFRKLSREQVREYVDHGESLDKAGGYAAQGYGMTLIASIRGSYTNVVGLPVAQLLEDLRRFED